VLTICLLSVAAGCNTDGRLSEDSEESDALNTLLVCSEEYLDADMGIGGCFIELFTVPNQNSVSNSLSPEEPVRGQGVSRRIQAIEFGPGGVQGNPRVIPASVRSGGMAVYYPPGAANRIFPPTVDPPEASPTIYIANWPGGSILVFDPIALRVTRTIPVGQGPGGLALSPDGRFLFTPLEREGAVAVVDREQMQMVDRIAIEDSDPFGIAITPDGKRLIVCDTNSSGEAHVIDIATKTLVTTIPTGELPEQVAINPEGSLAYITSYRGGVTTVVDLTNYQPIASLRTPRSIGVALDPLGRWVYVSDGGPNGSVRAFEIATNRRVRTWRVGSNCEHIVPSPSGRYIFASNNESDFLSVIDTETDQVQEIDVGAGLGPMVAIPRPAR